MDALDLLLNRSSQPRLSAPAPEGVVLENIMQAALRAPDHRCLTPWQFVICKGAGLHRLGEVFEQAAINSNADQSSIERAPQLPLRAPMVIVTIAKYKEDPKVPWVEQVASAACAMSNMQMAALAQGFQGVWRTGSYAQNEDVKTAFGCVEHDEILGFMYLGTSKLKTMPKPQRNSGDYFSVWE
ncbi:NAD(P)H nitroreductase [Brumicola blandensis]|uniref:Putative NAD(P)H nitroreductase n=1 Tax=Brumicola blandensis TaxID=3075611 RepID=A0AAW8QXK7_9ALTE|nr:NAD(P)H nitroreductase [Alteromonas sp. W409]MDT0581831.1 NAD(P)H nitroreductase [Alteromonas sp. W409]